MAFLFLGPPRLSTVVRRQERIRIMNARKLRKVLAIGLLVCLAMCTIGWGWIRWQIQSGLDELCATAQASHPHPGDDVAALIDYVQSESHSLRDRNFAVWALGQARDPRALPVLEAHYTGEKCEHDRYLCQGELAKAIKLCKGGTPNLLRIRTHDGVQPNPQKQNTD